MSEPSFDFQGIPENQAKFQQTAFVLENTGVQAYLGHVTNIRNPAYLAAAGSIALVEGRHAAVIGLTIDESTAGIVPNGPLTSADGVVDATFAAQPSTNRLASGPSCAHRPSRYAGELSQAMRLAPRRAPSTHGYRLTLFGA